MHCVACAQGRDGIKGRHWLLEMDLKDGVVLRLDKTSRSILVLLRHLGRIQEVGVGAGATHSPLGPWPAIVPACVSIGNGCRSRCMRSHAG